MAAIISAIARGFTSNQILRKLATNYPQYSNALLGAQAAGYTASKILSKIHQKKTGENLPEEAFMTEYEKARKKDDIRKRDRALTTIGVLGTAGALAAGGAYLANRNAAIQPSQILPAVSRPGSGYHLGNVPHTINARTTKINANQKGLPQGQQGQKLLPKNYGYMSPEVLDAQKQLPNLQKQLPNLQKQLPFNPISGKQIGNAPPPPQNPPQSLKGIGYNTSPSPIMPTPPTEPTPSPHTPLRDALAPQRNPAQSVDLVKNLKLETAFNNIIRSGHDLETTSELVKLSVPREVKKILEKRPGGIEAIVEDYTNHLLQNQESVQETTQQDQPQNDNPDVQQTQQPEPKQELQQPVINEIQEAQQEQPQQELESQTPEILKPSNLGISPKGEIGEIQSIENGIAKINVDGKVKDFKEKDVKKSPEDLEEAVRFIVNSVPENMKSTVLESTLLIPLPGMNVMVTKFYDGKYAWYTDVPENVYNDISLGTYAPKGQAITGIAQYQPGIFDSRGAGFDQEIKKNPKYSKENKGKTWGYAENKYALTHSIQSILHKISKERYDEKGQLIQPKTRKKSTT
jgi:hypothetical protein